MEVGSTCVTGHLPKNSWSAKLWKMVGKHAVHGKVSHWKQQAKHAVWTLPRQYKEHLGFWNGTCSWSALFWSASRHVYQPGSSKEGAGFCQKTCRYQACSLNLPDRRRVEAVGQACEAYERSQAEVGASTRPSHISIVQSELAQAEVRQK